MNAKDFVKNYIMHDSLMNNVEILVGRTAGPLYLLHFQTTQC